MSTAKRPSVQPNFLQLSLPSLADMLDGPYDQPARQALATNRDFLQFIGHAGNKGLPEGIAGVAQRQAYDQKKDGE